VILHSTGDITVSYGFINFSPFIIGVSQGIIDVSTVCLPEQVIGEYAGVIKEELRGDDPFICFDNVLSTNSTRIQTNRAPKWALPKNLPPYAAINTDFAQNNNSSLYEFQVCSGTYEFQFSVCSEDGGSFYGDTAFKLYRGSGDYRVELSSNDDGCDDGSVGSKITYFFDIPCEKCQNFTLYQGCFDDNQCGGQTEFALLKSIPTDQCPSWLPPDLLPAYSIITPDTVVDYKFSVCGGTHNLIFATCELPGAGSGGDTNLVLLDSNDKIVTLDTGCPNGGGSVINHDFNIACGQCQNFTLRQGCGPNKTCNGTVGFVPESVNYANAENPPVGVVYGVDCDGREVYNVSYIGCDFYKGASLIGTPAPNDCLFNADSNQMCYRPTATGHYTSQFRLTDTNGDKSVATQTVVTEGLKEDGLCLWQNSCAGNPKGCESGSFCNVYQWWSQCQENVDVHIERLPNGNKCYATNNGPMRGQRWGCNVDSDCCNPGATCGKNRLCHLPCVAKASLSWSEGGDTGSWWQWSSMDKRYQVSIAAVSSAAVLLVVVIAAMTFFSKQKVPAEENFNVVVEAGVTPQQSYDEQEESMFGPQIMIGDSIIPDEDQI
jgi:hypothetical protein